MTENTMTPEEVADKILDVRDWLEVFTTIFSLAELKRNAIAGEFEFHSLTSQTVEEYTSELIEGAEDVLAKVPKIQACEQCDFQTKKVLEKVVMKLAGPVKHAKWVVKLNSPARHRMAMQAILTTAQKLRESYSETLFDIAAAIRVRGNDPVTHQDKAPPAADNGKSQPADLLPDPGEVATESAADSDVWSEVRMKGDWEKHYQSQMPGKRCHWRTIEGHVRFEEVTSKKARIRKDDVNKTW